MSTPKDITFDHSRYAKGLTGYAIGALVLAYERDGLTRFQAMAATILFLDAMINTLLDQGKAELEPPALPPAPDPDAN